jgi:hypothetical protein
LGTLNVQSVMVYRAATRLWTTHSTFVGFEV